jgi:hypothetical protein
MSSANQAGNLTGPFSAHRTKTGISIEDAEKTAIIQAIWSHTPQDSDLNRRLAHWFQYYGNETSTTFVLQDSKYNSGKKPVRSAAELLSFIDLLTQNPQKIRSDLRILWQPVKQSASSGSSSLDIDSALDLTVRLLFMTTCRSSAVANTITTGQIFKPRWEEAESLEKFLDRTFPQYSPSAPQGLRIYPEKLTASSLEKYAKVCIQWTDHLPDHLILQNTTYGKYLFVFSHAGFLESCLPTTGQPNSPR